MQVNGIMLRRWGWGQERIKTNKKKPSKRTNKTSQSGKCLALSRTKGCSSHGFEGQAGRRRTQLVLYEPKDYKEGFGFNTRRSTAKHCFKILDSEVALTWPLRNLNDNLTGLSWKPNGESVWSTMPNNKRKGSENVNAYFFYYKHPPVRATWELEVGRALESNKNLSSNPDSAIYYWLVNEVLVKSLHLSKPQFHCVYE